MVRELVCEEIKRKEEKEIFKYIQEGQRCGPKDVLEQEESIFPHPTRSPC